MDIETVSRSFDLTLLGEYQVSAADRIPLPKYLYANHADLDSSARAFAEFGVT